MEESGFLSLVKIKITSPVEMVIYFFIIDSMPCIVWIWDVSKLEPISIICCNTPIKSLKWTSKGSNLSIAYGIDRILFWDPKGCVADCAFVFQSKKMNINKMRWSKDGGKMLICEKLSFFYA